MHTKVFKMLDSTIQIYSYCNLFIRFFTTHFQQEACAHTHTHTCTCTCTHTHTHTYTHMHMHMHTHTYTHTHTHRDTHTRTHSHTYTNTPEESWLPWYPELNTWRTKVGVLWKISWQWKASLSSYTYTQNVSA